MGHRAKVEHPKKKKTTKPTAHPPPSSLSCSSLPDELVVSCLARVSKSYYRCLSLVSKRFHSILSSPEIYTVRSQFGTTETCLYICLQTDTWHRWFTLEQTLITKGGEIKDVLSLAPIVPPAPYYSPAPSYSTTVAIGSEIYHIGKQSSAVRVFDCWSHTWRCAPNMTLVRKKAKSTVFLDGKIYVLGGCSRIGHKSMTWGEVFDLKTQTWKPLPSPGYGFDWIHKGIVLRGRLYVITTYKNYAYDPEEETWKETLELGFGLGLSSVLHNRPWCIIENVMFNDYLGEYWWCYDSSRGVVHGLSDLYMKRARDYTTVQLVNNGGKLVIIWYEWIESYRYKRIWCAVISLEKRLRNSTLEFWGKIEQLNVLGTVYKSDKLLSCLPVSL